MNWYGLIKLQQEINAPDAYTNYGHISTNTQPGQQVPEENLSDEMWIFTNGRFQRQRAGDFSSGDSLLDQQEGSHYLFTHDNVWPEIDEGRASEKIRFWKGRFDSQQNIVTVLGPIEHSMRDIPSIITRQLEEAYPGAQIKRFQ